MSDVLSRLQSALADQYRIERELGRGGMATVYLAQDLKHDRPVALKVLRPEVAASLGSDRFLLEIRLTARLQHPHILPVFDSGMIRSQQDDGPLLLWYTMPYVEGGSLRDRLRREGQLPLDEAVRLTREVSLALDYAHRHGVIHRDIKPENILIEDGQALVADFGVAWAVQAAGEERLTETGLALGTPAYMSPEQGAGEHAVDARTDIYSLGCVLYEMLAGEPPFTGPTPRAIIAKRLTEPVPHLSTVREVPPWLEQAATRSLARAPVDRFASAGQMAEALSGSPEAPAPARRRRPRVAPLPLALTVVLLLVAGYLGVNRPWFVPGMSSDNSVKRMAVLPFENLGRPEDEYFADGMTEELTTRLASTRGLSVIAHRSAREYKRSPKPLRQIARELGVQYVLLGTVRWDKAPDGSSHIRVTPELVKVSDQTALWAQHYDKVLAGIFEVQGEIAQEVTHALGAALLGPGGGSASQPTTSLEAYDYYLRGKSYLNRGRRTEDLRSAQEMLEKAIDLDPRFALADAWLSYVYGLQYWLFSDRTPARIARSKAAAEQALAIDSTLPEAHLAMGYYYYHGHLDYDHALAQYALAQRTRPQDADLLFAIGNIERRQGRLDESIREFERAEQIDPRTAELPHQIGNTYLFLRRYPEAARGFDRAIAINPTNVHFYADKAALLLASDGTPDRARRLLQALPETVDLAGLAAPNWPSLIERRAFASLLTAAQRTRFAATTSDSAGGNTVTILLWKAAFAAFEHRPAAEWAYSDSAAAIVRKLLPDLPKDWTLHGELALAYLGLGQKEDAFREAERAAAVAPSEDVFFSVYPLWTLAEIEVESGRHSRAIDHLSELLVRPCWLSVNWLRVDPVWDPLRSEPRFQRLVAHSR